MTPFDERMRGEAAKRVLGEAVYKEAWQAYEARLLDELANASRTAEEAERLRALLIASRKARAHLERIVNEGALAAKELELVEKQSRLGKFFRVA